MSLLLAGERECHFLLLGVKEGNFEGVGFAELQVPAEFVLTAEFGDVHQSRELVEVKPLHTCVEV